jgi:hypothetical protein
VGFSLFVTNLATGQVEAALYVTLGTEPMKNLDWHTHYNPIQKYCKNFKRLSQMEFITVKKSIQVDYIVEDNDIYS